MTNGKLKHGMGWRPDTPDFRDKLYAKLIPIPKKLPESVDLRKYCSKVEDQGQLGSCTANSLVGALEMLEIKDNVHFQDLSRLFVYYSERVIENTITSDSGAELRDGIKALKKWGVCSESCWAYDISKFAEKPPEKCYTEAKEHCLESYFRIITLSEMKACLASGFGFVYGFSVYESMETEDVANSGIVPFPQPDEEILGGHAVLAVGYDDRTQRFMFRNSWGEEWGDKGYGYIDYKYLTNRDLSEDFWTLRRCENL